MHLVLPDNLSDAITPFMVITAAVAAAVTAATKILITEDVKGLETYFCSRLSLEANHSQPQ
jgi:hypothetical protein